MPYDWRAESEKEGSQAAKLPYGRHFVHISRLVYGSRDGSVFESKSGDPQMMIIFEDSEAREASLMVTLSHKAAFVLARLMAAFDPPLNLERMTQDGIEPTHFAELDFAESNLLNRRLEILVEKGRDDKYPNVTPVLNRTPAAEQPPQTPPRASYGTPPPQPPTSPPTEPPPQPPPVQQPAIQTEENAWMMVMKQWPGCDNDAAKANERNNAWFKAVKDIGKPKQQFTPADWQQVVDICTCPF